MYTSLNDGPTKTQNPFLCMKVWRAVYASWPKQRTYLSIASFATSPLPHSAASLQLADSIYALAKTEVKNYLTTVLACKQANYTTHAKSPTHTLASSGPRIPDGQLGFTNVDYISWFSFHSELNGNNVVARGSSAPHKPCQKTKACWPDTLFELGFEKGSEKKMHAWLEKKKQLLVQNF